ncbi:MAG: sigma-70 family RNA polymerase sigma factor [Vicinamibacterales bacterium]
MEDPPPDRPPEESRTAVSGSTSTLFRQAADGSRSAARSLVARLVPDLRRWGRGKLPSYARGSADTEDIAQGAALGTLRRIGSIQLRSAQALPAYMRRSFMNLLVDAVRKVSTRGAPEALTDDVAAPDASPLEQAIRREEEERVRMAAMRLHPTDRQILLLRLYDNRSFADIRTILGKRSDDAARMAFNRALERLATELGIR